ncbi:hypothetical protein F2Q68_00044861 [Brassica cretica]|uniref:Uncharacterized protein n=1 Tax=Brassica cretica TaxID=69181 RepID=A0A8S9LUU1_BRACR|nr:hypothetical protein F2Q68_00044861 [Brassica cretica]
MIEIDVLQRFQGMMLVVLGKDNSFPLLLFMIRLAADSHIFEAGEHSSGYKVSIQSSPSWRHLDVDTTSRLFLEYLEEQSNTYTAMFIFVIGGDLYLNYHSRTSMFSYWYLFSPIKDH